MIFTQNFLSGFYFFVKFLEFSFVVFYVAQNIKENGFLQKIAVVLSVGVIFESLLAVAQFVRQGSLGGIFYYFGERFFTGGTPGIANAAINGELILRPYATFPHPNVLAGYLLLGMILIGFVLSHLSNVIARSEFTSDEAISSTMRLPRSPDLIGITRNHNRLMRFLFVSTLLLGSLALFLSMSRVAIILWIVVILISFSQKLKTLGHLVRFLGISIAVSLLISIFLPTLIYRFSQTSMHEESFVYRQELLSSASKMIAENPLTGVGLGNFLPTLATIPKPVSPGAYLQPVHNIYLLVAAEIGIIGFVFFVYFLFQTLFRSLSLPPLFFMFSSILAIGFFDHYLLTLQQGQLLFALIVGLCWAKENDRL